MSGAAVFQNFVRGLTALSLVAGILTAHPQTLRAQGTPPTADAAETLDIVSTLSEQERATYEAAQKFLKSMGYEDFSAAAQATLDADSQLPENQKKLNQAQRQILTNNRNRLDVINATRDLASYILARAAQGITNQRVVDRMAEVTARALNFGIKGLPEELPPEIQNIKDKKEKAIAADRFLQSYIETAANETLNEMRADIMSIFHDAQDIEARERKGDPQLMQEKLVVTELVRRVVVQKYTELELTQSRFLGRALALGIVRYARKNNRPDIEQRLAAETLKHGEVLSNYISDTYVITSPKGDLVKTIDLKTADILSAYSRAQEGPLNGIAFYPQGWIKKLVEYFRTNLGLQSLRSLQPLEMHIMNKKIRGEKLTITERFMSAFLNLPIFRRGHNTVGLVDVKVDPQTGLKATWLYRNNSNNAMGGVQFEDVRNFLTPGYVERVGHMRFSTTELVRLNMNAPYADTVKFGTTANGSFQTRVTETERRDLLFNRSSRPDWVQNEVGPLAINQMQRMMIGNDAVGFDWGAKVDKGLYSSGQTIVAAFGAGAGIETQDVKDSVWVSRIRSLDKEKDLQNRQDRKVVGSVRMVAPTTWIWNAHLGEVKQVDLPKISAEARVLEFYGATRPPINARIYAVANSGVPGLSFTTEQTAGLAGRARRSPEYQYMLARQASQEAHNRWENINEIKTDTAQLPNDRVMSETQMREFLFELGMTDVAKDIREAMAAGRTWSATTAIQQEHNLKTYEAMNAARELSILLMDRMQGRFGSAEGQKHLAELAAYLLSQQPINPVKKPPTEIESLPEEQRAQAFDEYLKRTLRQTMEEHTRVLVADLSLYLYGNETLKAAKEGRLSTEQSNEMQRTMDQLYKLGQQTIERMYMDHQVGQTRFAGRAFAALVARQGELRNQYEATMKLLQSATSRHGLHIENFLGTEWLLNSADGKGTQRIPVDTLNFVMTRAVNMESSMIPWGAQPDMSLRDRAIRNGLVGNPLSAALVVDADAVKDGYSALDAIKDKAFFTKLNSGFSHIGYVVVQSANNSKIKMSWVVDNYPHPLADAEESVKGAKHNPGGLRFAGLEQFYATSHHSRIVVAAQNADLIHKMAMERVRQKGVPKAGGRAFAPKTFVMKPDADGKPTVQTDKEAVETEWKIEASQAQLDHLYSIKDPKLFWKTLQDMTVSQFKSNIVRGMTFLWITPHGRYQLGGGYCSGTLTTVMGQAAGFDPEFKPSRWITLLKIVATGYDLAESQKWTAITGNDTLKNLVLQSKMDIIAPSSLAAQSYVDKYYTVTAPVQNIRDRAKDDWSFRTAKSSDGRTTVELMLPRSTYNRMAKMKFDATEVRAFAHDVDHNLEIKMGKIGASFKTLVDVLKEAKDKGIIDAEMKEVPRDRRGRQGGQIAGAVTGQAAANTNQPRTAGIGQGLRCELVLTGR